MKKTNIDFDYPDRSFHFSAREVFGHYTMLSNHFHDQYEIYYLLSGERHYFIKDRIFHVKSGTLVLINRQDVHRTTDADTQDHVRVLLNFSKDYLLSSPYVIALLDGLFMNNNYVIPFLSAEQQYVEVLLDKMIHEIEHQSTGFQVALQALLMDLLVYTSRYIESNRHDVLAPPSQVHEKISQIVQYINTNYQTPLTLSSVAQNFFVSQYYLSRTFKQATGFTFVEYINNIRIREAQRLLRETNHKVIDISEAVGFGSISHFGRVFKEVTRFSPLNYRRLNTE
ncbi:helix-turn-helix- domain containing protein, AraC type [Alkaliphilus metalliredigens QYMF]|uniref:Helix-turn-helix-domain containing protein, AraC type n=1 Tax=Alkaliphilus metalliredigens (strain QYMF) TaxID=293826 RepID=A6TKQ3_ALKMQ|nr:AraC family transcriptional regulator [Alkaliphilus metalliredigens]ABR46771.1 helix-turn-helix- domain containing protein, AraC type [Alkaliphilus metalliredigens QYMF]